MAWALVPWNAKELMPVTDGADSAGATCLGNSRPRPAALLLNVASRCGFNCIIYTYFVEWLVMQSGMYIKCCKMLYAQYTALLNAQISSIEPDCCHATIVSCACSVCQTKTLMGDDTVPNTVMCFTEQQCKTAL